MKSTDETKIEEKEKEPTIVVVTGKAGEGMTYLAHDVAKSSGTVCNRCGRTLSAPRSVAVGYGPVCYMILFEKPQPPAPGEALRVSRRSGKISEIDLSNMTDLRTWFE